ncbi:hypothetical protein VP01_1650g2 [Puccinia sorghi]|uniref:Uncharacterized protein n=1 Tax=Puccinia sorghi TaxID=27349 RepID=A0A0L6VGK0_9BASI|nr:hypothetical protein VP01_1650g2 [Puccinia sorghi]
MSVGNFDCTTLIFSQNSVSCKILLLLNSDSENKTVENFGKMVVYLNLIKIKEQTKESEEYRPTKSVGFKGSMRQELIISSQRYLAELKSARYKMTNLWVHKFTGMNKEKKKQRRLDTSEIPTKTNTIQISMAKCGGYTNRYVINDYIQACHTHLRNGSGHGQASWGHPRLVFIYHHHMCKLFIFCTCDQRAYIFHGSVVVVLFFSKKKKSIKKEREREKCVRPHKLIFSSFCSCFLEDYLFRINKSRRGERRHRYNARDVKKCVYVCESDRTKGIGIGEEEGLEWIKKKQSNAGIRIEIRIRIQSVRGKREVNLDGHELGDDDPRKREAFFPRFRRGSAP